MCDEETVGGDGWQHPDPECQDCFEALTAEFYYCAEGQEMEVGLQACTKTCWEEFVRVSQREDL